MGTSEKPLASIASKALPKPLLDCIHHIFQQKIEGTALVGGTALAGFYAGHRRSDDIDLFCANETAFRSATLAVKTLEKIGATFSNESRSAQYFHANCVHLKHSFTVDVVLDENLFRVGTFEKVDALTVVPTLNTLLKMKVATLVSRCAEKDLFDLQWLFNRYPNLKTPDWIKMVQEIDRGATAENLLASIAGTKLREAACAFSLNKKETPKQILKQLTTLQKQLIKEISQHLKDLPTPPLGKLVKKLR